MATWFLFGKLLDIKTLIGFGEKWCQKNLPLYARNHLLNPFESPQTHDTERNPIAKPLLTRQRVFWFGLGGMVFALMLDTGSKKLFVGSPSYDSAWDFTVAVIINVVAAILFLAGIIALLIYHWFPDATRKYSWRRKRSRKPGQ